LDVLNRLRDQKNRVPCLIVTTFGEDDYVMEAIRSGADGFVLKSGDPRHLLTAVHATASQGAFFSPPIARRLLDSPVVEQYSAYTNARSRFEQLTPREQEILIRLSEGATNAEIATAFHLAPGTVKVHVSSILRTTGARNRVEAALIAIRARQVYLASHTRQIHVPLRRLRISALRHPRMSVVVAAPNPRGICQIVALRHNRFRACCFCSVTHFRIRRRSSPLPLLLLSARTLQRPLDSTHQYQLCTYATVGGACAPPS